MQFQDFHQEVKELCKRLDLTQGEKNDCIQQIQGLENILRRKDEENCSIM